MQSTSDESGDEKVYYRDVHFSGFGGEPSELPWGQRYMWNVIRIFQPRDQFLNLALIQSVPQGIDLETVLSALESLLNKHESLRTRYHVDEFGHPKQEVISSGKLSVEIRELATEEGEPSRVAEAVWQEFKYSCYNLTRDFPVKAAVITRGEIPHLLVIGLSHMAADGWGLRRVQDDLADSMGAGERSSDSSAPVWQPRDQFRHEQSPVALRRMSRTLEYFSSQLENFPSTMFWSRREKTERPRYLSGYLDCPALLPAVSGIYKSHNVTPASAILAAFSLAIGHKTCREDCCLFVNYSNRDRRNAESVANYTQSVPVQIDLTESSFWRHMQAVHRAALNSYKFATCSPSERRELIRTISYRRGVRIMDDCLFNALWFASKEDLEEGANHDGQAIDPLAQPSTFTWKEGIERGAAMYIETQPGSLGLIADTKFFQPEEFEETLRLVESLLIKGAKEDFNPTDLLAFHSRKIPGGAWSYVDNSWINLETTRRMIAEVTRLDFIDVAVLPEGDGEDKILVARLREVRTEMNIDEIRLRCLEALPQWRDVMVPHHIELNSIGS